MARSVDNYDRMTLLYIMDKGYPGNGLIDEYPDNFSFHEKFERIENKLLGKDRWDVYDEMQEKAMKLAESLLKRVMADRCRITKNTGKTRRRPVAAWMQGWAFVLSGQCTPMGDFDFSGLEGTEDMLYFAHIQ